MRRVILYKGEDGYWIAECPTLPGCVSQGKTVEEATKNIKEAVSAYITALEMDHLTVPPETDEVMIAQV
ncbi:MAG TPA: type II toxin-antitoxin system HicB family antitoxin [Candidatus Nanoarchaeia archaeon]|nr:type II toxin-antitoxin system HicB family antitoxin [Candidatus Nanoarchaeia archaeon]